VSTRAQNERKFDSWEELPNGGRRYKHEVAGRLGWKAIYIKEVDRNEQASRFWQEIYNERGEPVELHLKYPVDTGHQKP
jgi:hypothetical protein